MALMRFEHARSCSHCNGVPDNRCDRCNEEISGRIMEEMGEDKAEFLGEIARHSACNLCGGTGKVPVDFGEHRAWTGFVACSAPESVFRKGDTVSVNPMAHSRATAYMPQWMHDGGQAVGLDSDVELDLGTTEDGLGFSLPFSDFEALLFVGEDDLLLAGQHGGESFAAVNGIGGVKPKMRPVSGVLVELPEEGAVVGRESGIEIVGASKLAHRFWRVAGSAEPDIEPGQSLMAVYGRAVTFRTDRLYGRLDRQSILAKGELVE